MAWDEMRWFGIRPQHRNKAKVHCKLNILLPLAHLASQWPKQEHLAIKSLSSMDLHGSSGYVTKAGK